MLMFRKHGEEAAEAYFQVVSHHSTGGTEDHHKQPQKSLCPGRITHSCKVFGPCPFLGVYINP